MKSLIWLTALVLVVAAQPAAAQQPTGTKGVGEQVQDVLEQSGIVAASDSVAAAASPELKRAVDQLAVALSGIVARIAGDAQLRNSAVQAAHGMVGVAQIVVAEQADALQDILRAAAEQLGSRAAPEPAAPEPR